MPVEHDPSFEEFRYFVEQLQRDQGDRMTVEMGQHVIAVFDWMERRLDALDDREGA